MLYMELAKVPGIKYFGDDSENILRAVLNGVVDGNDVRLKLTRRPRREIRNTLRSPEEQQAHEQALITSRHLRQQAIERNTLALLRRQEI
jgi:hypothetical protein